jgi:hypothetical protein
MGYVTCVTDTARWVWDFWVENLPEAPQVTCKTACVDFKLQQPLECSTNVSSKCRSVATTVLPGKPVTPIAVEAPLLGLRFTIF